MYSQLVHVPIYRKITYPCVPIVFLAVLGIHIFFLDREGKLYGGPYGGPSHRGGRNGQR